MTYRAQCIGNRERLERKLDTDLISATDVLMFHYTDRAPWLATAVKFGWMTVKQAVDAMQSDDYEPPPSKLKALMYTESPMFKLLKKS